ncbi:probable cytochrome P450 49a1 [Littorina saxatilis]|uniref:Cytochrome P450 n=1 Tax=Littorina saxatilis TaxID=31220 RepID=A0AAN9B502_9CAEN
MSRARAVLQRVPEILKQTTTRHTTTFTLKPLAAHGHTGFDAPEVGDHVTSDPPQLSDIPGPRSLPGIGAMWQYLPGGKYHGLDLNIAIKHMNTEHGDVVREEIVPGLNLIRLYDPNDFADVYKAEGECPHRVLFGLLTHYNNVYNDGAQGLLTSQDSEWKQLRSQVQQPILQPKAVNGFAKQHANIASDFVDRIARRIDDTGSITNFLPEIYKYVTEGVGTVCFDKRLGLLEDNNAEGEQFIRAVGETLTLTQKELQLLPLYRHVPTPVFARFTAANNLIQKLSTRYMQEAMQDKEHRPTGQLVKHLLFHSDLTQRHIFTFLSEFFAAGVDTTGHYLAFTLYALAKNPKVQEKLYSELKDVTDDDITSGALESAPYLRAFLKESLRVYPVAPGLGRTLRKDAVLGGYNVPAGTNIVLQYDLAGKDPRFVSNPEEFQPERWLRNNKSEKVLAFTTLPFGFGPRSCPGRRLAGQEVGVAVAKILQRFRVCYNGGELPIKMQLLNTPAEPLNFCFTPRSM